MTKIAILSDIHGNLEALTAALNRLAEIEVDRIICLGDVVGYGPDPMECWKLINDLAEIILMGNHEDAVINGASGFNPSARRAVNWTRRQLEPGVLSGRRKKELWEKISTLPTTYEEDDMFFVHASPADPICEYLLKGDLEGLNGDLPEKIKKNMSLIKKICFIGHTHTPGIITDAGKWISPADCDNCFSLKDLKEKIICNVGSVGQPRDYDNRASFVILSDDEIQFYRVPYEYSKTVDKIEKSELDDYLANRLETGR